VKAAAAKLADKEMILKSRVFPYQLMIAFLSVESDMPVALKDALQDAMEIAVENVPVTEGAVVVCPDVSGSMSSPVTGHRAGATTAARCIDIAALVASVFLRKNAHTLVLPFEHAVVEKLNLNGRDSIMTNAQKLAGIGGGGTNCSAPLHYINKKGLKPNLVVFVSDNESWVDSGRGGYRNTTGTLAEWEQIRGRNPSAKLVCIDIQPNSTGQAPDRKDILNIGGFSDSIFETINRFVTGDLSPEHWVGIIDALQLD
jgi:60 kDa SS-A/Ro ribonucleoprotein